jgi:hypothetical protein
LFIVSVRQLDIASKAAFTALRASAESPGTDLGIEIAVSGLHHRVSFYLSFI